MAFKKRTTAEKKKYARRFSSAEIKSYRKGKRAGFLDGVHAPRRASKKKTSRVGHSSKTISFPAKAASKLEMKSNGDIYHNGRKISGGEYDIAAKHFYDK